MKDTYHDNKAVQAIAPAVVAANTNGKTVALKGYDSALFVVNTGAIEDAGDFTVKLQESDTGTNGWNDVEAQDILGAIPETLEANSVYRVGYIGSSRKQFVRAVAVKNSGTSIALGVVAILGHSNLAPVA